jgi:hypothetical protein
MLGILDEKYFCDDITMWLMVKHDSLDKATLNDEALSIQQKLYNGRRFTSYKAYLLSCS